MDTNLLSNGMMMKKISTSVEMSPNIHREKWKTVNGAIDREVRKEELAVDAIQRCYEVYVRNTLYEDLEELSGKNIGCWCKNSELCHGTVLIKLYQEKVEGGGEAKRKKYF